MRRIGLIVGLVVVLVIGGSWWVVARNPPPPVAGQLSVVQAVNSDAGGFTRASTPRTFQFPVDHGPHPGYQTEWWYYTGNLNSADGRHWGYQLTFFRRGLIAQPLPRASDWGTTNLYMAHFALTDVTGKQFYAFDRFSRDGAGLAGAQGDPFRVWLESWSASGSGTTMQLQAKQDAVAIDLQLQSTKPPVLQGNKGLSQKSAGAGNASYYYSLTRMATSGTITVANTPVQVTGLSWMDREWSTSVLGADAVGWDWFALQLSDGREIMYYQLRLRNGGIEPFSSGTLIGTDGTLQAIKRDDVVIDVLDHWHSAHSGATYPSGWHLRLAKAGIDLQVKPYLQNQELPLTVVYWEGASHISGTSNGQAISGNGYVELTGYGEQRPAAVQVR